MELNDDDNNNNNILFVYFERGEFFCSAMFPWDWLNQNNNYDVSKCPPLSPFPAKWS